MQDEEELGGRLAGKLAKEPESGWQRDAPAPGRDRERPGGLRAETVIVTGRVTPCSVSQPGSAALTVRPPPNPAGSRGPILAGWVLFASRAESLPKSWHPSQ